MQHRNYGLFKVRSKSERGYSLLEYAFGATVLISIVWAGVQAFGGGLNTFFQNLGIWVGARAAEIGGQPNP